MTTSAPRPLRRTVLYNARLLDPASGRDEAGGLIAEHGRVEALGPQVSEDDATAECVAIDCGGHCLAPGLIDMRVQLRDPGEEYKETIETGSRSAAAGGITSMVCLPNTEPVIDDAAVLEFIARRAREARLVKVYAYAGVTRGLKGENLTEIGLLQEAGAVGFTDGLHAVDNARVMRRALSYAGGFGALIVQHPEEPSLARWGCATEGEIATRLGLPGIPLAAEAMMIERDMRLVEMTGGRYHAAHISTGEAVEVIRQAKRRGLDVSCETAPPYFALNETEIGEYRTFARLSPPLRAEPDRQSIVAALADGTIDVIVSDHAPHDVEVKRLPFAQAAPGVVGLETLLPLALELYHNGAVPLLDLLAKMTCNPADLLGLDQGRLEVGRPADLVLFDLDRPCRVDVGNFRSKSKNSPFDGRPVQGCVLRTLVDGRIVYTPVAG